MIIVAGLGNPDAKYSRNMHNVGFMVIDKLAEKYGVTFEKRGFNGVYSVKNVNGEKVMFIKPQTYMNNSGECLRAAAAYYKVPTSNLIVAYDDIDLPIGSVRIRASGSAGTHNGMSSVVSLLGSEDFPRVRVGIKPDRPVVLIDYVLSDIRKEDLPEMERAIESAAAALDEFICGEPVDKVMRDHNSVKKNA